MYRHMVHPALATAPVRPAFSIATVLSGLALSAIAIGLTARSMTAPIAPAATPQAAELAVRYFKEQSEMLAAQRLARRAFKCGPAENARAWRALIDEFFAGRDLVPGLLSTAAGAASEVDSTVRLMQATVDMLLDQLLVPEASP